MREIYLTLRPGEPPATKNAEMLVKNLFFTPRRYDLSRVGRYRMNKKLGITIDTDLHTLTVEDLVASVRYILSLNRSEGISDDIDHLGNRRVRTIGELLEKPDSRRARPDGAQYQRKDGDFGPGQHHA